MGGQITIKASYPSITITSAELLVIVNILITALVQSMFFKYAWFKMARLSRDKYLYTNCKCDDTNSLTNGNKL